MGKQETNKFIVEKGFETTVVVKGEYFILGSGELYVAEFLFVSYSENI